jgi:hypothetical protein
MGKKWRRDAGSRVVRRRGIPKAFLKYAKVTAP